MNLAQIAVVGLALLTACSAASSTSADPAGEPAQRGEGAAYELLGTQVFDLADPASGRAYQLFVSLPKDYDANPDRRYPTVYVTDADYGFPMLRLIARRMNGAGPRIDDFILIGLSYETRQDPMTSRRRDYTPTPNGPSSAPRGAVHGLSLRYRDYLDDTVIPFVEGRWRSQSERRIFVGHSYGGLLGAEILLTRPEMFSGYVLGSTSFWFDKRYLLKAAPQMLDARQSLDADVYLYVGEYEALRPGEPRYQQEVDMVGDNATFADLLAARGYDGLRLKAEVLDDEDHLSVAPRGFTRGLEYLLPVTAQ